MDLGGLQQFLQNRKDPVPPVGHRGLVKKGNSRTDRRQQGGLVQRFGQSHQHAIQIAGAQHGFEVRIDVNLAAQFLPDALPAGLAGSRGSHHFAPAVSPQGRHIGRPSPVAVTGKTDAQ